MLFGQISYRNLDNNIIFEFQFKKKRIGKTFKKETHLTNKSQLATSTRKLYIKI